MASPIHILRGENRAQKVTSGLYKDLKSENHEMLALTNRLHNMVMDDLSSESVRPDPLKICYGEQHNTCQYGANADQPIEGAEHGITSATDAMPTTAVNST